LPCVNTPQLHHISAYDGTSDLSMFLLFDFVNNTRKFSPEKVPIRG